ncbi:MAG: SRPBCC family protein [Proteobacteria bacterium]|nr:SRPBCC family protein [Pseudomonadota bacterium]
MALTFALFAAALVAMVFIVAAFRPDQFTVTRSAVIATDQQRLYAIISDLANFDTWSPWSKLDTGMKKTLVEPTAGVGGSYAWDGNGNVGAGKLTIAGLQPVSEVRLDLDFLRPFAASNRVVFALVPKGEATRVTWTMTGPVPILARVMHMFMDMDRLVGGQFEQGLANLQALAETQPGGDLPGIVV